MKRSAASGEKPTGRIAVIEEVADNIYSVKFILQSLGYSVSSFASDTPKLTAIEQFDPQFVIVDMMIPNQGGYETIRRIHQSSMREVPVLAITAAAMEGEESDVFEAGGHDVLPKPYTVAELQEKLKKWLPQ